MKKMKNHIKVRCSTTLLCIVAILLCAAPRGWAVIYDDGGTYPVTENIEWLHIGADTTVNLYADISQYVYAHPGSVLNIYSGNVGLYIIVWPGAKVTVYGTNFAVKEGGHLNPSATQFTVDGGPLGGVLTGTYGNGDPIELRFVSSVPIQLSPPATSEVEIDIKPGGNPNTINLKSKGVVPVAVLTTDDFNASDVDPDTVLFAGAKPLRWKLCDVDDDGDDDMLFHFKTQELFENDLDEDSTEATLTGTANEVEITGTDAVRIVPQKKK